MRTREHVTTVLMGASLFLASAGSPALAVPPPPASTPAAAGSPPAGASVTVAPGVTGLTASAWQKADPQTVEKVQGWLPRTHAGWTPNRGQIASGNGTPQVLYAASSPAVRAFVTTQGLSLYFYKREEEREDHSTREEHVESDRKVEWSRLDVVLKGAIIRPDLVSAEHPLLEQGERHFYLPHCPQGVLSVPSFGRVTIPDVYPGIDWVLRSEPGKSVEHDFVVHPGGDPGRIRLEFKGAESLALDEASRSLRVRTALGELREGPLRCYQDDPSRGVDARFRLQRSTLSVAVGAYDRNSPLVIDPPLLWSTYYGGDNFDGPRTIFCDDANDVIYVVGYTASSNMPDTSLGGAFQGAWGGGVDGFIWKFSQLGVRLWATYYGGSAGDEFTDCTVDASGNLYVSAKTTSTNFPTWTMAGAYNDATSNGGWDCAVLKFNALGVRQWATHYGGSGLDQATGIACDSNGRVFVCGHTNSADLVFADPGGNAYYDNSPNGTTDALLLRFGTLGALEWATYLGGADGDDAAFGIAIGGNRLVVSGSTASGDFPTADPGAGAYFVPTNQGNDDIFISRFTTAGVLDWSTYYGGADNDFGDEPAVDATGNVFVCGFTASSNLPTQNPGLGAYFDATLGGLFDSFLLRFDAAGVRTWATYLGGSGNEFPVGGREGRPIAVDAQGRVYYTMLTESTDFPVMNPGGGAFFQLNNASGPDAFITRFTGGGVMQWSTYMGSTVTDFGRSVAVSSGGCLFLAGEAWGGGTFVTQNPGGNAWFQSTNAGLDDGFIAKFCVPTNACCIDNNCLPATSAAHCTAMGGTAYHPGQTCPNVVCTTLCTICGRKFADTNRNGVQDGGEAGLPGWTIELRYPNGVLYGTQVTGANGDYCFSLIPCGEWRVTEQPQLGWLKVYPASAGHSPTLNSGTTLNGVNFGNYQCGPPPPCNGVPPGIAAWWRFDEHPGGTSLVDVAHTTPLRNVALCAGAAGGGAGSLCVAAPADYARVPLAYQHGVDVGTGSFAIATWLNPTSSTATRRVVIEKRTASASTGVQGWSLYLDGAQSILELGTGGTPQTFTGPTVGTGAWSHVAVSVDRNGLGRWYVNGSADPILDFAPPIGSLSSSADLMIGQADPAGGTGPGFAGCIAELMLFTSPLTAELASKAAGPGGPGPPIGIWCPEVVNMPAVTNICQNQTTAQMCFSITNSTGSASTIAWSLAGQPAGPGCTQAGPTQFSPSSGTVVVAAGSTSVPICVTITRPVGFTTQGATSCFSLTFANTATGICRTRTGKLRVDNTCWCVSPISDGVIRVPTGASAIASFSVHRPCDPVAMAYRVRASWPEAGYPDPLAVSLDGLTPGTPATGLLSAGPGADQVVEVEVSYPHGYDPAARYELVLEADADGDLTMEPLASVFVEPGYDTTAVVAVPPMRELSRGLHLRASPNPFLASSTIEFALPRPGRVELGVYDLSGRLVKLIVRANLEAGPHRYAWDGRDERGRNAAAGVYLVRMLGSDRFEAKLVKMR